MSDHRPIRNTTGANHDPHLVHRAQHLHTIYTIHTLSTHTTLIYIKYPVCVWAGAMISLITMFWWSHYMCNVYQAIRCPAPGSSLYNSYTAPVAGGETSADTAEDGGHLPQLGHPLTSLNPCGVVTSALDIFTILQFCNDGMDLEPIKECPLHQRWMGWPVPDIV